MTLNLLPWRQHRLHKILVCSTTCLTLLPLALTPIALILNNHWQHHSRKLQLLITSLSTQYHNPPNQHCKMPPIAWEKIPSIQQHTQQQHTINQLLQQLPKLTPTPITLTSLNLTPKYINILGYSPTTKLCNQFIQNLSNTPLLSNTSLNHLNHNTPPNPIHYSFSIQTHFSNPQTKPS